MIKALISCHKAHIAPQGISHTAKVYIANPVRDLYHSAARPHIMHFLKAYLLCKGEML